MKIGGIGVVKSPHYSQVGLLLGLKTIDNDRELKTKQFERVWGTP